MNSSHEVKNSLNELFKLSCHLIENIPVPSSRFVVSYLDFLLNSKNFFKIKTILYLTYYD